jgi:hypothetical protein
MGEQSGGGERTGKVVLQNYFSKGRVMGRYFIIKKKETEDIQNKNKVKSFK